jgi:hypothetical protein
MRRTLIATTFAAALVATATAFSGASESEQEVRVALEHYLAGHATADEAQRKRRIVSVDVSGDAAQAKVELDYPTTFFTDYFNLLKVDGKWMIVNKTFHARPKP